MSETEACGGREAGQQEDLHQMKQVHLAMRVPL